MSSLRNKDLDNQGRLPGHKKQAKERLSLASDPGEKQAWLKAASIIQGAIADITKVQAAIKAATSAMPTKGAGSDMPTGGAMALKLGTWLRQAVVDLKELAADAED